MGSSIHTPGVLKSQQSGLDGLGLPDNFEIPLRDPLAGYMACDRDLIQKRLELLTALVYHVGKDLKLVVRPNEPGEGWYWNFNLNEVRADPVDILEKPLDYCRFVICHEGAHVRISRIGPEAEVLWKERGFPFLVNCIEDPRVNNYAVHAYPFLKDKMDLSYTLTLGVENRGIIKRIVAVVGFEPLSVQGGLEYIRAWLSERRDGKATLSESLHPKVRAVLNKTLDFASYAWRRYPTKLEADRGEEVILKYCKASQQFICRDVWPHFKTLLADDVKRIAIGKAVQQSGGVTTIEEPTHKVDPRLDKRLTSNQRQALNRALTEAKIERDRGGNGRLDPDKLPDDVKKELENFYNSLPGDERQRIEDEANKLMDQALEEANKELEGKLDRDRRDKESDPKAIVTGVGTDTPPKTYQDRSVGRFRDRIEAILAKDLDAYTRQARIDSFSILRLVQNIEAELNRRAEEEYSDGFKTGARVNLQKRASEVAHGVQAADSSAWQRLVTPHGWSYAFSFLVDLSPSMQGNKIAETFRACVVISEALRRTHIPFEIVGFNNDFHVFKRFGDTVNREVRARIGGMIQSTGGSTDMGFGVLKASEQLFQSKAADQILVVLTDGTPEPSSLHSGSEYAMDVVVPVVVNDRRQRLLAVGLGVADDDMKRNFPGCTCFVEDEADKLFRAFARIVQLTVQE